MLSWPAGKYDIAASSTKATFGEPDGGVMLVHDEMGSLGGGAERETTGADFAQLGNAPTRQSEASFAFDTGTVTTVEAGRFPALALAAASEEARASFAAGDLFEAGAEWFGVAGVFKAGIPSRSITATRMTQITA